MGRLYYKTEDLTRSAAHPPEAGFRIKKGMAETTGTVPLRSVFEFTAPFNVSALTALRIEVPPANATDDIHSPEKGFIVNHIDAWVMRAERRPTRSRARARRRAVRR